MSLAEAWEAVCHHIDGIAAGPLIEALHTQGVFHRLARQRTTAHDLEADGLTPGDAALALKLLLTQAIVLHDGNGVVLTPFGKAVAASPQWHQGAADRIAQASAILGGEDPPFSPPSEAWPERIRAHHLGPLVAALCHGLFGQGIARDAPLPIGPQAAACLQATGWAHVEAGVASLTEAGRAAITLASQYAYPLSYLPTFAATGAIITGQGAPSASEGEERHVDRALDIAFSGIVFTASCKDPFLEALLPLFDKPLDVQPSAIVDTGSGDGTVLVEAFKAIKATTRGQHLDTHPLTLVGVEYNEVARCTTEARLAALDTPSLAIAGDIGDPNAIGDALEREGLDPLAAVHVNKSVLHNRTHRPPAKRIAAPPSRAVFIDPSGRRIPTEEAFGALVALLAAWRPFIQRHGMISIEAHTVDPVKAGQCVGRSLITSLDAAHGLSRQYLMEIAVHRAAADAAGLQRLAQHDVGAAMMGEPIMSIDHLIVS
ncbi:MAG: hypothetical protein ROR55_06650 [Devosia sp.]